MSKLMFNGRCYSYGGEPLVQPVIYSEDEREVGVWINGKPLYQRTFIQSFTSSGKVTLDTGIEYCHTIQTSYLSSNVIDTPFYLQSSTYVYCYVQRELDNTMTINNYYNGSIEWIVTVQYTKVADQPGSGTWIPSGALATHYSTDEHVVGTWIDGSTVYEKVVETTFNNASPRYTLDLSTMDGTPITLIDASNSFLYYDNNGTQIVQVATQAATNYTSSTLTYNHQQGAVTGKAYVTIRYTKREVTA